MQTYILHTTYTHTHTHCPQSPTGLFIYLDVDVRLKINFSSNSNSFSYSSQCWSMPTVWSWVLVFRDFSPHSPWAAIQGWLCCGSLWSAIWVFSLWSVPLSPSAVNTHCPWFPVCSSSLFFILSESHRHWTCLTPIYLTIVKSVFALYIFCSPF